MGIIFSSFNGLEAKLPYIKFSTSQWQQKNFSDLFTILSNNTHSRAELTNYGTIRNIHYGDVLIKFGNILDTSQAEIPYLCENCKYKDEYMQDGDIIIADTAEDYTAGKCTELFNVGTSKIISGLHTIPCRPKIKFAQKYLGYYTNSPAYRHQLLSLLQGIKVYSISKTNLSNTHVSYPPLPEQQKIADFLSLVDQRIEKQRQLVESLKKYKRGLLSAIFDNKLIGENWKKYKLSSILKERSTYSEKDGSYEHVTLSRDGIIPKTERYDRDFLVSSENKKYKITKMGDICYNPANMKFGVICLNTYGNAIFSPIYITFEIKSDFDKPFVGLYMTRNDFINRSLKFQQGTVYERMAVSPEDLLSMDIELPNLEAQKRISNIFTILDKKIVRENNIFNELQKMKRALLQQMFI